MIGSSTIQLFSIHSLLRPAHSARDLAVSGERVGIVAGALTGCPRERLIAATARTARALHARKCVKEAFLIVRHLEEQVQRSRLFYSDKVRT